MPPDRPGISAATHLRKRALAAAEQELRAAAKRALLATCDWIEAGGRVGERDTLMRMDQADRKLNAARELYDRVSRGSATAHEIVRLLRRTGESIGAAP